MDTDSIIYIVITIAILLISGLGNRRKRQAAQLKAQQMKAQQQKARQQREQEAGQQSPVTRRESYRTSAAQGRQEAYRAEDSRAEEAFEEEQEEEFRIPGSRLFSDQFRDLAKSFGQPQQSPAGSPFDRLEQFLTGQGPQTPPPEAVSQEEESTEGVSMEETMDEEAQILEEIRKRNEDVSEASEYTYDEISDAVQKELPEMPILFEDADDIKKAIIYSEILGRKYT